MMNAALLSGVEAARVLAISARTLAAWRRSGSGPLFVRMGYRTIRYRAEDLTSWVESLRKGQGNDGHTNQGRMVALPIQFPGPRVHGHDRARRRRLKSDSR